MGKYTYYYCYFNIIEITINNFRVFENDTNFKISPITILTGTNSSGKSSFIKALKLLVRSYEKSGLRKLEIMETDLKLGGFNSILNSNSKKEVIEFDFIIKGLTDIYSEIHQKDYRVKLFYNSKGLFKISLFDELGLLFEQEGDFELEYKKPIRSFLRLEESILNKSLISKKLSGLNKSDLKEAYHSIMNYLQNHIDLHDIKTIFYEYNRGVKKFDLIGERINRVLEGIAHVGHISKNKTYDDSEEGKSIEYIVESVDSNQSSFRDLLPLKLASKLPDTILNDFFTEAYLNKIPEITDLIHENIFSQTFSKFEFIGGIRASQELIYTNDNNPEFYHLLDSIYNSNETGFIDNLEYWLVNKLKILTLPDGKALRDIFKVQQFPGLGYIISIYQNGTNIGLSGLGYGIAQLLPIILKLLINFDAGKTYIIEEPESNLHPALQSQLADLFQSFINGKLAACIDKESGRLCYSAGRSFMDYNRIIIETHSEYLIRKLQYFTAKGVLDTDKTIIYYFNPINDLKKGDKHIKVININRDGSLTDDFGAGFFDEAASLKFEILKLSKSQKN